MESQKIGTLYAVGLGLLLSDLVPTPADAVVFWRQRLNKTRLERGEITPKEYWIKETANYYLLNPIWWGGVLLATHYFGKSYKEKRNVLIGLIAAGAVVGVIAKNIKKDEEFYKDFKVVKK